MDYIASTSPAVTEREERNKKIVRRLAADGMVLLENRGVLPMVLRGQRIALFGGGARHTVMGGTGSGEVNVRDYVTVEEGLINAGAAVVTDVWLDRYDKVFEETRRRDAKALLSKGLDRGAALWAFAARRDVPAVPLEDGDMPDADAAIYILSRNSGEGADRRDEPGDYELTDTEKSVISTVGAHYGGVIVVLNVGGVLDTSFLRTEPTVTALLLMSQPGEAGGDALADVLTGKSEPGGRLAATWARQYSDYPCAATFSHRNGDTDDEYYKEGIFVGYRWFDSFGKTPAYPFGYGLSYTSFSIETECVTLLERNISIAVRVRNTGMRSGREVVQVYVTAPEGRLAKPYQELRAFGKTRTLQPGETETLNLMFPVSRLASFNENSAIWLLEPGEYLVRVGEQSRKTTIAAVLTLEHCVITELLHDVLRPDIKFEELNPDRSIYYTYPSEHDEYTSAPRISLNAYIPEPTPEPFKEPEPPEPVQELSVAELAAVCVGTERGYISNIGEASERVPGAAGESVSIKEHNIRGQVLADGPAGLRLCPSFATDREGRILWKDTAICSGWTYLFPEGPREPLPEDAIIYYQYCTAIPIATLLAQTWDVEAVREAGELVGEEMELFDVDLWLAPGMNIQRNPLCGRNFEYYSEDPLLSGSMATADTQGVQSHSGRGTTIKHFCCNNQEDNRNFVNSHVSRRALREIYLRGFEQAVRESQPKAIMTSYNLLNGVHTANSRELLTTVLRGEWGFEGFVMTDWGTTSDPWPGQRVKYPCSDAAKCVLAGNDLTMPGSQRDVERIISAVEDGILSIEELKKCAGRILMA